MVSTLEHTRANRAKRALGLGVVAMVHVAWIFAAYRSHVLTHAALWSSDFFVFGLPTVVVFAGYVFVLRSGRSSWLVAVSVATALIFVSFWLSLFVAFNTYGT
jgi:hypothetical protein